MERTRFRRAGLFVFVSIFASLPGAALAACDSIVCSANSTACETYGCVLDPEFRTPYCDVTDVAPAGTPCGGSDTGCDAGDTCNGGGTCVDRVDSFETICRDAAGECDFAEVCDGSSKTCPANSFAATSTPCTGGHCSGTGTCIPTTTTTQAPTPPSKCSAQLTAASAKKSAAMLKCYTKAIAKARLVDSLCLQKAQAKFDVSASKALGQADCLTTTSQDDLNSIVNTFVGDLVSRLTP